MLQKMLPVLPVLSMVNIVSAQGQVNEPSKPLNIVYIMTDDHAYQAMSCYDKRYISTPNLDRLAAEGVRFTNSFVCNSISGPSRAALMTGKHSHKNGKTTNETVFDNSQQTFPKLLQKAGYQTAIVGKWHLDGTPTGFNFWEILPGQGEYYNPDFITPNGKIRREGYVTNIITDLATQWLDQRDTEKPFCLMIHHKAIHRIWMADTTDIGLFEDKTFPMPTNFWDDYEGRPAAATQEMSIDKDMDVVYDLKMKAKGLETPYGEWFIKGAYGRMNDAQKKAWDKHYDPIIQEFTDAKLTGKELAEWKYQRYMKDYMKTVKSLDDNIGKVYDYLKSHGLLENTIIVYTSDQGFYMGEHGWFDKRFMYEESMRTPLVMRLPESLAKRGDIPQLVQNIDYAPTLLEIAGAPVPEDIQGVSMLPLLKGEKPKDWRKSLYYHYTEFPGEHSVHRHYGVRTDRYKLIRFYKDIDSWELYDLKKDPMEMHNEYNNPKYAKIVKQLQDEIIRLQVKYDDPIRENRQ